MKYKKKLIGYRSRTSSNDLREPIQSAKERLQRLVNDLKRYTEEIDSEMYKEITENRGKSIIKRFADYYNSLPLPPTPSRAKAQQREQKMILQEIERLCNAIHSFKYSYGINLNTFSFDNGEIKPIKSIVDKIEKEYLSIYLETPEEEELYNRTKDIAEELNKLQTDLRKKYAFPYVMPSNTTFGRVYPLCLNTKGEIIANIYYFDYRKPSR